MVRSFHVDESSRPLDSSFLNKSLNYFNYLYENLKIVESLKSDLKLKMYFE